MNNPFGVIFVDYLPAITVPIEPSLLDDDENDENYDDIGHQENAGPGAVGEGSRTSSSHKIVVSVSALNVTSLGSSPLQRSFRHIALARDNVVLPHLEFDKISLTHLHQQPQILQLDSSSHIWISHNVMPPRFITSVGRMRSGRMTFR